MKKKRRRKLKPISAEWRLFINGRFRSLIKMRPLAFAEMNRKQLPEVGGVYLITALKGNVEIPYYVGRSKNLSNRIYRNHLMGALSNARLKKYLISTGECRNVKSAKRFIKEKCFARWIEESGVRKRGAIEGYVTGLLFPKHGIYEEH